MPKVNLTKQFIDNISNKINEQVFYDTKTTGLHLKVSASGRKAFYLYYRNRNGDQRRPKIAHYGVMTLEQARAKAKVMLGEVAKGNDPSRKKVKRELKLFEFAKLFSERHILQHVKPSTAKTYHSLISTIILPRLGKMRLNEINRTDIESFMAHNKNRRTTANHAMTLLKLMFEKAKLWEMTATERNPCSNIQKFKRITKERFLTEKDVTRLINVLGQFEHQKLAPYNAIIAIKLLVLTGCRKNEIVMLTWNEVLLGEGILRLLDSKTGGKEVILSTEAIEILKTLPSGQSEYVFPGKGGMKPIQGLQKIWERIRKKASLGDVRLHDLRHTFASIAVSNGVPLYEVGKLLGHASIQSTQRYAHLERASLRESLNKFSYKLK